jgi:hypothetical protein
MTMKIWMKRIYRDIGVVQNVGRCCNGGMPTLVVSNAFPNANPKTSKILTLSIEGYFNMPKNKRFIDDMTSSDSNQRRTENLVDFDLDLSLDEFCLILGCLEQTLKADLSGADKQFVKLLKSAYKKLNNFVETIEGRSAVKDEQNPNQA